MAEENGESFLSVDDLIHAEKIAALEFTPEERERAFGEIDHVRYYGYDIKERLLKCGFEVQLDLATNVQDAIRAKYGLLDDENIFYCRKN